jgi:cyanate lyase
MSTVQHLPGLPPVCKALHAAKAASKLSFEQLATQLGRDEVFVGTSFPPRSPFPSLFFLIHVELYSLTSDECLCRGVAFAMVLAAIFYGQAVPTDEDLKKLVDALGDNLPESASLGKDEATMGDGFVPVRG